MNKTIITFALLLTVLITYAQSQTEYNIKGDEAMKNLDYGSAKIYYEDGVVLNCDLYSINQLTSIWLGTGSSIRNTMRGVMTRSLKCLDERATSYGDTTSMKMLILFYENGIGADVNEAKAEMWRSELDKNRNPYSNQYLEKVAPREKEKMNFFVGYAATLEAPYGITFGGVGRTVGWYLRFRTNMSSQNFSEEFQVRSNGDVEILGNTGSGGLLNRLPNEKVNTLIATGGLVFKLTPSFYISAGGGYCKREYLREFQVISDINGESKDAFWAKYNGSTSFDGKVALDLDGTFKIGNTFYGSLGCSVLSFKYVSANAGIGVFF